MFTTRKSLGKPVLVLWILVALSLVIFMGLAAAGILAGIVVPNSAGELVAVALLGAGALVAILYRIIILAKRLPRSSTR